MTDQDPTQRYEPPAASAPEPVTPDASAPDAGAPVPPPSPLAAYTANAEAPQPPAPAAFAAAEPNPSEPAPAVATAPVEPAQGGRRGSRARWLVAGILALVVAGTALGATMLLTGSSGASSVAAWTPADSLLYGETRLDLPGDQAAELAKLMQAFPGFDDQAAFPVKLSEALDQLTSKASDGKVSWKTDIEPWFGGQIGMSIGKLPAGPQDAKDTRAVVVLSVKDAAKAKAWADKLLTENGATTSTQDYNGAQIVVVNPPSDMPAELNGVDGGYVFTGPVLALGDVNSLKAVVDTKGTAGIPTNEQFKTAMASVKGDRIAYAYLDYKSIFAALGSMLPADASAQLPKEIVDQLPAWIVETFRVEESAFVLDATAPHSELNGTGTASTLPGLVPSGTIALVEGHDFGKAIQRLHDQYAGIDSMKDAVKQLDDALALLGGLDAVSGWMGEAGVAITKTGDSVAGGIVAVPTDKAAAERLFTQLKGFIQLGGADAGISVTDEDYNGTTITVVDLSSLSGLAGAMAGQQGVDLPSNLDVKLAYAVTDKVVALGYGTDFVKAVLDASAGGSSLASDARFKEAIGRVGATRTGLIWVDVAGIRSIVEPLLPADMKTTYESDVKPYLDAFDYLLSSTEPGTTYDTGIFILKVTGS